MQQYLYSIFPVEFSDKGFYFKKSEDSVELYITTNGRPKQNDWQAKSILSLGAGDLYVVHWEHPNGKTGMWFLNKQLKMIANKTLLFHPNLKDTHYSKLWSAYLNDIIYRVWYTLITPDFIHKCAHFSPSETFISDDVMQDVKSILNSFFCNQNFQFVDLSSCGEQFLKGFCPSIQESYAIKNFINAGNWQDKAIAEGYIESICPFTGELIKSNESLLFSEDGFTTAYRFQSQNEVFFLITSEHANKKDALFFPRQRLFLFYKTTFFKHGSLQGFLLTLLKDWKFIKHYLLDNNPKKVIASSREAHIGHHLWNELSALERMVNNNTLKHITYYYVKKQIGEPFGLVDQFFPQLSNKVVRINMKDFPCAMYQNNYFHVRPGGHFISLSLVKKIIDYSTQASLISTFSQNLQKVNKEDFAIIILFTLRIDNRSWLEQEKGICEILTRLSNNYIGKIALIIDGHNTNESGTKLQSHGEAFIKTQKGLDLFDEEYLMAERIKENISSDKVIVVNTIGCSVQESINWCLKSDFFVAPWGAGLAKYKWVTNSPGLVFSSKEVLLEKPDLHIYDSSAFRENAIFSEYLDVAAIDDIEEQNLMGKFRKNFTLSIDVLYEKIKEMVEKHGRNKK